MNYSMKNSDASHRNDKLWYEKKFRFSEFLAEKIIKLVAFISFAVILLIFVFVFREALPVFYRAESKITVIEEGEEQETYGEEFLSEEAQTTGIDKRIQEIESIETSSHSGEATLENILGKDWQPISAEPKYGILPLLVGSFKVTLVAIFLSAPIAILAALFTAVFASKWAKEILKPTIEILAGFPSIVIGFFALIVLATFLQTIFGLEYRLNAFVGGVALSLAVIPIIYTITEDAINAIPKSMVEASYALGAAKWQTALFVMLPASTPGVFAAILLGIGRAFGETMIVLMATGNAAILSADLAEPVRTLTATIGAEMAEVVFGDTHYNVLFLIGSLLFIFTFTLNAIAEFYVRNKLLKKFRGE